MTEAEFFDRIAAGESVRNLFMLPDCPFRQSTFYRMIGNDTDLWQQYARAKETAQHAAVDSIMSVIDQEDDVHRARLKVDAIKWAASKLAPRVYGDRTTLVGDASADAVQVEISGVEKLRAALGAKSGGPADGGAG